MKSTFLIFMKDTNLNMPIIVYMVSGLAAKLEILILTTGFAVLTSVIVKKKEQKNIQMAAGIGIILFVIIYCSLEYRTQMVVSLISADAGIVIMIQSAAVWRTNFAFRKFK